MAHSATTPQPTGPAEPSIGTLAKIAQVIRLQDGTIRAIVQGQRRIRLLDLVQTEPEQLLALRPLPGPGAPVRQVRGEFLPPRAECAVRPELVVEAGELVQHGALLTGAEQRDGFRLAVHRDQRIGQL